MHNGTLNNSATGSQPAPTAEAGLPAIAEAGTPDSPSADFLARIPHEFARRHLILSAGTRDGVEHLRITGGLGNSERLCIFNVGVRLGRPIEAKAEPAEIVAAAIDRAYEARQESDRPSAERVADGPRVMVEGSEDVEADLQSALRDADSDLLSTRDKPPVIRLVDLVLFEALMREASDVHIQPVRDATLVRYRLDGVLHTVRELPARLASSVVSRVKVMARLDVAETRAPQDGRATVAIGTPGTGRGNARRVDLRISTLPSTYGERVVIRLLDPSHSPQGLSFSSLGMQDDVQRRYLAQVSKTSGIVLSTGPTGSGKSTTLYTTLGWIAAQSSGDVHRQGANLPIETNHHTLRRSVGRSGSEVNILTIEDPVEYDLSAGDGRGATEDGTKEHAGGSWGGTTKRGLAISQTQVDPKKNVTFATGLRHILRQDPDVIMVGEIRDEETARMAVQASLTGHLVLSTLHTNDAPSAIARLLDLGVEPFLVGSSLAAVLAQRLVRTVHAPCAGKGCATCLGTGFKGRTGVFELLVVDEAIRVLIGERASTSALKQAAIENGMVTLLEAGTQLVRDGITTPGEMSRVIQAIDEAALSISESVQPHLEQQETAP